MRPQDQSVTLMDVTSRETATFTCQVRAAPLASIEWTYNPAIEERVDIQTETSNSTYTTNSVLTLSEVMFSDRGTFGCTASNGISPSIEDDASLTVYGEWVTTS